MTAQDSGSTSLLQLGLGLAQAFDRSAALFRLQPALSRGGCCFGGTAQAWHQSGAPDQLDQPIERILPIAFLCAMTLRGDHERSFASQSTSGQTLQAETHIIGQTR